MYDFTKLAQKAKTNEAETRKLFTQLRKKKPKDLDKVANELHDEAFDEIDCLECANCCRSLGPRILDKDIERMGKALRMKPKVVIEQYLRVDEDNDYVFKTMPCPFLMPDNYCMIYEHRPKACREYPHTDSRNFYKHLKITILNSYTCPAVPLVIDGLSLHYNR